MLRNSLFAAVAYLILGAFIALPAAAQVRIEKPWARATVLGASVGGGFLTLMNQGAAPDRLIGASSPVAARTEIHEMAMEKDVMRMREVKGIDIPAHGKVELKPGGYHLMFQQLKAPLKQGEKVPVTLKFEKAGDVKVDLAIESVGAGAGMQMNHGGMKH
jgi:copper(I)-binding protein